MPCKCASGWWRVGKGRWKAQKGRNYRRERSEKGNLTRASPRTVPMRTCLLLPHAFKYKETRFVDGAHATSMEFVGYSWGKLRDARPPCPARGMHFVHTVSFVAPFTLCLSLHTSFLFYIFFTSDSRATFLSIHTFFFILAGEYHRRDPTSEEATLSLLACIDSKKSRSCSCHLGKSRRDDSHRSQWVEIYIIKRIWKAK